MANFAVSVLFKAIDGISESFEKWSEKGEKFEHEQKKHFEGAQHAAQNFVSVFAAGVALKGVEMLGEGIKKAVELLPEFAEKGETIVRTSAKLGLTTDAFQRLGYAAHMAEVPAETLEKSMAKLNLGMGQLSKNQGALDSGLRRIDPSLRMQIKTAGSGQEAFLRIADAIQKTSDPAKRAAIAVAAFGKSGQDMIPFLMQGREEITKTMGETTKFGSYIGEEALRNSEKFTENIKKMKGAFGGLKDQVLGGMLSKLSPILDSMTEWIGKNRDLIDQRIDQTIDGLVDAWNDFQPMLKIGLQILKDFAPAIKDIANLVKSVLVPAFQLLEPVLKELGKFTEFLAGLTEKNVGQEAQKKANDSMDAIGDMFKGDTKKADKMTSNWIDENFGHGLYGLLGSDISNLFGIKDPKVEGPKSMPGSSPNSAGLRANSASQFQGRLDIAGAPPGSKLTTQRGAPGFSTHMADVQGQN